MATIRSFTMLMLILVPIGTTARVALCLMYASTADDPAHYKKKAFNAIVYAVLAETITGVIRVVSMYFGGGVVF